jgi:predicted phage tail component-like protein
MDGEHDYSTVNTDNEVKYKPRTQECTFSFDRNKINWRDPRVIRQAARKIAAWLGCGEAVLIFDDESDKQEYAKVSNKLDLENQIESGRPFTVDFKCRPFPCQIDSVESITLDSNILLDSDLRLDDEYQFTVIGNRMVEVNNFGTHSVKPVIEITGSFTALSITVGGKTLNYTEAVSNKTIVLDCALLQAKDGIINKNNVATGLDLILPAGISSVEISGTALNCTVTFKFRPLYY